MLHLLANLVLQLVMPALVLLPVHYVNPLISCKEDSVFAKTISMYIQILLDSVLFVRTYSKDVLIALSLVG